MRIVRQYLLNWAGVIIVNCYQLQIKDKRSFYEKEAINSNWSAAIGPLRFLHHISRILQNRIADEWKGRKGGIDRKLKQKIDEKKQAHGLRQE